MVPRFLNIVSEKRLVYNSTCEMVLPCELYDLPNRGSVSVSMRFRIALLALSKMAFCWSSESEEASVMVIRVFRRHSPAKRVKDGLLIINELFKFIS